MDLLNTVQGAIQTVESKVKDFVSGFGRVKPTSEPSISSGAVAQFTDSNTSSTTQSIKKDTRVRLKVPDYYRKGVDNKVRGLISEGIVFPYTPTINQEYSANYNSVNTVHSNYTQYFYKGSTAGPISLTARFTVQNPQEAQIYLGAVHLLRSLTKMKFGDDDNAGAPPPVCRLMAYGDYMFDNVPVVVASFRLELPDNVDYFTLSSDPIYGTTTVPVYSTINLVLNPIYSRAEMLAGTVNGWLNKDQRSKGYL